MWLPGVVVKNMDKTWVQIPAVDLYQIINPLNEHPLSTYLPCVSSGFLGSSSEQNETSACKLTSYWDSRQNK